jgi:hypothetical protein
MRQRFGLRLFYLEKCREVIFREIQSTVDQTKLSSSSDFTNVRLPDLEAWTGQQLGFQNQNAPLSDGIPAIIPQQYHPIFLDGPHTTETCKANPAAIDERKEGLGGSRWKRESPGSLMAERSLCNAFLDPRSWTLKLGPSGWENSAFQYDIEKEDKLLTGYVWSNANPTARLVRCSQSTSGDDQNYTKLCVDTEQNVIGQDDANATLAFDDIIDYSGCAGEATPAYEADNLNSTPTELTGEDLIGTV